MLWRRASEEAGSDQIAFAPDARIGPGTVNDNGELRFEGTGPNLANLFTPERLRGMTGSGLVEFRRTDNQLFDLNGNAWSDGRVALRVTDSNPTGLNARLNSAGGPNFAGTVHLEWGARFDVAGNRLSSVRDAQDADTTAEEKKAGVGPISHYAADPGSRFAVSRRAPQRYAPARNREAHAKDPRRTGGAVSRACSHFFLRLPPRLGNRMLGQSG